MSKAGVNSERWDPRYTIVIRVRTSGVLLLDFGAKERRPGSLKRHSPH